MELTASQDTLMKLLKCLNIEMETAITIVLFLQTEKQRIEMIYYIKENQQATKQELLKKVTELIEKKHQELS